MARISNQFSNAFLNTSDVESLPEKRTPVMVIRSVDEEDVGGTEKLVISFKGTDKRMTLNKTNALDLAKALGDETDEWRNCAIVLTVDKTMFQGKRVPCLRILEAHLKDSKTATAAAAAKQPLPFV